MKTQAEALKTERPLTYSMFLYWLDGSTPVYADPDPPGAEEARPFVVCVRNDGWVPVNALVFARDEKHAEARVRAAINECCMLDYHTWKVGEVNQRDHRAFGIRDDLASGELRLIVQPFDIACMPSVQWAMNGGL